VFSHSLGHNRTFALTLEDDIQQASDAFGLRADIGFVAELGDTQKLQTVARITAPGCKSRVLIFRRFEDVQPFISSLAAAGYGYSVLGEPRSDEHFHLESWRETFRDWALLPR